MTSYGAVNADKSGIRYEQTNRTLERFLKDLKVSGQTKFYLESCGYCSTSCAIEGVDGKWKHTPPVVDGADVYSHADLMFFLLYSKYGQQNAPAVAEGVCENEVLKNLAWAVPLLSDAKAEEKTSPDMVAFIDALNTDLKQGKACVVCYKTNYGSYHYVTLTKRYPEAAYFEGYDPWSANMHCASGGVKEKYTDKFLKDRCRLTYMRVWK